MSVNHGLNTVAGSIAEGNRMSDVTGSEQSQSLSTPDPVSPAPEQVQTTPPAQDASERLFKQSEVNDIVGRAKREAIERHQRQQANIAPQPSTDSTRQGMSSDDVRRMIAEESHKLMEKSKEDAQRKADEDHAQRIAGEFFTKLGTGKEKYEDFEKTVGDLEFGAIPHVVQLANMVDNTPDVIYELAKNPTKIAAIQQLIQISPKLAYAEMQRLSASIKTNEEAGKAKSPNAPLSQLRPSIAGTDKAGQWTVSDARKKYKV